MTSSSHEMTTREFIQRLLAPERAQRVDTFAVFTFSEINDRDTVADIGCGPGYFTIPLAKAVYNGKLYALDINDEMLEACRRRVEEARLGNVEVLKCGEFEFPVKEGALNGAFLAFVVQQSPDKPRFLEAVRRLLRPGGGAPFWSGTARRRRPVRPWSAGWTRTTCGRWPSRPVFSTGLGGT